MVSNADTVRTLERIADLLEIKGGDNTFKARAYRQAAVQVENLSSELASVAHDEESLRQIAGFGPGIAQKMAELISTGRLAYLEQLEAEIPPTLVEIRSLPGVGPRTAAMLWTEAGITTLDELDAAARAGRLSGLPRMGAKVVANIVATLDERRQQGAKRRRPREDATPLVDALLAAVRALPTVECAEVAGSYRRLLPTVGDLDIVVATAEPVSVLSAFATIPHAEKVLLRGDTKCSIAAEGLQVDCRAVGVDQFGAAWQYFTGSQAHNIRLRGLALRMGLTLNEYGLFTVEGGMRVAGATEEDVYAALGLRWIEPSLREDRGEVEAARLVPAGSSVGRVENPPTWPWVDPGGVPPP
jgi:DNA polymerase (family X)